MPQWIASRSRAALPTAPAAAALLLCLAGVCVARPVPRTLPEFLPGPVWTSRGGGAASRPLRRVQPGLVGLHERRAGAAGGSHDFDSFTVTAAGTKSTLRCAVVNAPAELVGLRRAVDRALAVVGDVWDSSVPVNMRIGFVENKDDPDLLAVAGGTPMVSLGPTTRLLPVGAAEAMYGRELNARAAGKDQYDVLVSLNAASPWYTGGDGMPGRNQYDLTTVLIREIYHSLMFSGAVVRKGTEMSASLLNDRPTRFDGFLTGRDSCSILGYLDESDPSVREMIAKTGQSRHELFATALRSSLYFSHYAAGADSATQVARMSPASFKEENPSPNHHIHVAEESERLMTETIERGVAVHQVGPKTQAIQKAFLDPRIAGASSCRGMLENPALERAVCERCMAADSSPATAVPAAAVPPYTQPPAAAAAPVYTKYPPEAGYAATTASATTSAPSSTTTAAGAAAGGGSVPMNKDGGNRVGGLPVWAFVLVLLFSILALALLVALCVLLVLALRRRSAASGKSYTYSSKSSKSTSGKSRAQMPAGSNGGTLVSSERISEEYMGRLKIPGSPEYGGILDKPAVKTEKKAPICKKTMTPTTSSSSSSSSTSSPPICKTVKLKHKHKHRKHRKHRHHHDHEQKSHHHHHHHHHCKKYYCHCCRCKGKVESSSKLTSTSKYTSTRHSTTSPSSTAASSHKRKCCPCSKCQTTSTVRISVC